jgi:effector-binding domain-containing protein
MEAKKLFIAVGLIVLVIVLSFIPFNNKREIVIKAQLYDAAKQINDLHNWKKWYTGLEADSIKISGSFNNDQSAITSAYSYTLHHLNPLAVSLIRKNNSTSSSIIEIAPQTDSTIVVSWNEKIIIFEMIKRSIKPQYSRQTNLNNLKKLLEDVNYKYSFLIKIVPVKDTLILTAETSLADKEAATVITNLYRELQAFIKENMLPAEKKYFYKTRLSNNKIAVGIPVYKQAHNRENIKLLQLPHNGRLVEGIYSGKVSDKRSIYNAINNFMLDQHLKQVAQPLEQYNVADTILQPNSNVNVKIYYPVF